MRIPSIDNIDVCTALRLSEVVHNTARSSIVVIEEDEVLIDPFTLRILAGRLWMSEYVTAVYNISLPGKRRKALYDVQICKLTQILGPE